MARTAARCTSIEALRKYVNSGRRSGVRHRLALFMHDADRQQVFTRRSISEATGIAVNEVSGRVNELIKDGILLEGEQPVSCPITGNTVQRVSFNHAYKGKAY